jgi:hypothetical protein
MVISDRTSIYKEDINMPDPEKTTPATNPSTGPKTPEGKVISSMNAVKHGLYSSKIVIDSSHLKEDQSEYDLLLSSLMEELQPQTPFQECLVRKIVNALWRSRRIINAETAHINRELDHINPDSISIPGYSTVSLDPDDPDYPAPPPAIRARALDNLVAVKSVPRESFNLNLLRYEMRLDRQLTRAYRLLRLLQISRQAKSLQNHYNGKQK